MEEEKENEIEEKQEEVKKKYEKKEKIVKDTDNFQKHRIEENKLLEKVRGNPWIISTFVCGALVLILLVTNFGGITGNVVSEEKAAEIFLDSLNSMGADINQMEITDVSVENGLYKILFNYQNTPYPAPYYITRDGKLIGPLQSTETADSNQQATEIPKTDKPKVDLYVMSFCPYGNRGENTMVPVYNLLKNKIDFNVHYIVSISGNTVISLHGQPEVDENEREACVLKDYGFDAWWKFVVYVNNNCGSDGSCWKEAAKSANLDSNKIQSCVSSEGLNLMKKEADASNSAGASGSPTLIINGVESSAVYQYGNADAYKQSICSAFKDIPSECSTQLQSIADSGATGSC